MATGTQTGERWQAEQAQGLAQGLAQGEWVRLIIAYAAFILVGLNDGVVGVLLPSIIAHYGVSMA
ncbi:MAG TPA: hypothetical protein VF792_05960, partial [Ktedonobacterales bacterium]